jgi:hypothetical protein
MWSFESFAKLDTEQKDSILRINLMDYGDST